MMRRFLPAVAVAFALFVPQDLVAEWEAPASWGAFVWQTEACGGATLENCMDFQLHQVANTNTFYFSVRYSYSEWSNSGKVPMVGLYDLDGWDGWSDPNVISVEEFGVWSDGQINQGSWTLDPSDCDALSGEELGGANLVLGACAGNKTPHGFTLGQTFVFKLTADPELLAAHFGVDGTLGGRAHLRSLSNDDPFIEDCSIKFDTRLNGGQGGTFSGDCAGTSVPEPGTMLLLGTGLAGILGMGAIRRRREDEVEVA